MFCYEMSKMSEYTEDHVIAVDKPQGYSWICYKNYAASQ